jgi:predicted alternative tryptophan synthase beta-subunit
VATRTAPGLQPPEFARATKALREARLRPEVRVTEVPAPSRIAPFAFALTADVLSDQQGEEELATGRFVLLHDPAAPEAWQGPWRAVTFARAELEPELSSDPVLGQVGWSWLVDALETHGLEYHAEAGTVTRVVSESFAGLADRPTTVEMEVRASWSPVGGVGGHLEAWADLLCTIAGLPPLPAGVVALPGRRR